MTRRSDTAKRNRKIKNYAIAGYTRGQIASMVHMHVNSVAAILRSFVMRGELMEVDNSSPRIYYDPRECAIEQTVDPDEENDGCVETSMMLPKKASAIRCRRKAFPWGG